MQQFINGLSLGSVDALLGLSVTLLWGVLGVLTFAQAQVLTWGAFGTLVALHWGWPAPIAVAAGVVVAGVLSVATEVLMLAPLRRRGGTEFAVVIATIGAGLMLEAVLRWRAGADTSAFPNKGFPSGAFHVGGVVIPTLQVLVLVVSVAAMVLLGLWINRTGFGRKIRAVAYSEESSELLGIDSRRVYWAVYFVSGALAALAAVFVALSTTSVSYSSGDPLLLVAFAVIILGGMGSTKGAVAGGLLLGLIQVYATVYVSSTFREAVAFLLILLVLFLRPSGLFGEKEVTRV